MLISCSSGYLGKYSVDYIKLSDGTEAAVNGSMRVYENRIEFDDMDTKIDNVATIIEKREESSGLLKSESMMQYLPELYRASDGENGFMTRFMSIFDSIFFDMDERIAKARSSLDYRIADGEMLRYLAEWIMTEDAAYLSTDELRKRIRRTAADHRRMGTREGLSDWIQQEYGVKPNIIEYFSVKKLVSEGRDREVYRRLFGTDPYKFYVLLPEKTFSDTHEANIFTEKLKNRIPAYTEAEVVILKKNVILENHTYLGVNSVISGYSCAEADAGSIAGDIILGGSNDEEQ